MHHWAPLTAIQRSVLRVFEEAVRDGDAPPTYRELCARFGWTSTGTARDHLGALRKKGFLQRTSGQRNHRLVRGRNELRLLAFPSQSANRDELVEPRSDIPHVSRVIEMPAGLVPVKLHDATVENVADVVSMIDERVKTRRLFSDSEVEQNLETVDPVLRARLRSLAARIASVGCSETATHEDLRLMQALTETDWRWTPLIQPKKDSREYAPLRLPHQAGWHVALTKIFELAPMFLVDLLSKPAELSREQRRRNALMEILRRLVVSGAAVPERMRQCFELVRRQGEESPSSLQKKIALPMREYVRAATQMLDELISASGELRLSFSKSGGRGEKLARLSPWGAAVRFAEAFNMSMPARLHEARRVRKRQE